MPTDTQPYPRFAREVTDTYEGDGNGSACRTTSNAALWFRSCESALEYPPFGASVWVVIQDGSSLARKQIAAEASSGPPNRWAAYRLRDPAHLTLVELVYYVIRRCVGGAERHPVAVTAPLSDRLPSWTLQPPATAPE